jgi:hypothetical protein
LQDSARPAFQARPCDEPSDETSAGTSLGEEASRRPRWRVWLGLLVVLLAVRITLPIVVGPLVEERLSRLLGGRVAVGDVSFGPIGAVVTLHDVTFTPPSRGEGNGADDASARPVIAAERVRVDVQWLPLLHRSVVVRELAFESARIDLAGLSRDGTGVERFLQADPATELPPGWTFGLDRIALRDTRLRVPDPGARDREILDVGVREAGIATRGRRASAFRRAPNLRIDALVEGGRIQVVGHSDLRDDDVEIDARIQLKDLPLDRALPHLPDLGWSAVEGRLSGRLHYQRDPGRRDLLTGALHARRIALRVPTSEEPALTVRRVDAEVDAIDLRRRRLAIGSLRVHGGRLAIRADVADPVPLFGGLASSYGEGSPSGESSAARPRPADTEASRPPWTWSIREASLPSASLHFTGADGAAVLRGGASGENIGPGAYWSPVRAWASRGFATAFFDGTARMTNGWTIDGRLSVRDVDVPALAGALGIPHADLVRAGRGSADLDVELEPGATELAPFDVSGRVALTDVEVAGPEPISFAAGARSLDLTLVEVAPARVERGRVRPARVRFRDATLTAPRVFLTRDEAGWSLPPFAEEPPVAAEAGPEIVAVAASGEPPPSASLGEAGAGDDVAPPAVEVLLDRVQTRGGSLRVVDRATKPELALELAVVEAWAGEVLLPELRVSQLVLQGTEPRLGAVQIGASATGARRDVEVAVQSLPLAAATPYLAGAGLPYWFVGGTGSLLARIAFSGDRWTADTTLTLREPQLGGDATALHDAAGLPIEAAFDTLRGPFGDVTLRLPLVSVPGGRGAAIERMVASALRVAVANARRAPLPDAPIRIAFAPGRTELDRGAPLQLATLTDLLEARSDVRVELAGAISREDRRWLAEQAAAAYLDEPDGVMGVLRVFGVRDQSSRIREALAARAAGHPGRLDADDEAMLRRLVAAGPPIAEHRLAALAAERARRVADLLARRGAISPDRLVVVESEWEETAGPPSVEARVAVAPPSLESTTFADAERW